MPEIIRLENKEPPPEALQAAVAVLRGGGVVALPTETFYGLAADPLSEKALTKIFAMKRRPSTKPLLLLMGNLKMLSQVVSSVPPEAEVLMKYFWPGPLTLVFPAKPELPRALSAGSGTVAVRLSSHPVPTALSRLFGRPITGTSANRSGAPAATTAEKVAHDLPGVDLILDGGPTPGGAASTIVDLTVRPPKLLRRGKIPWGVIKAALEAKE